MDRLFNIKKSRRSKAPLGKDKKNKSFLWYYHFHSIRLKLNSQRK